MHEKQGDDLVEGQTTDDTSRASQSDEIDQTVLDCLTKRAQLEALQHQTEQSIVDRAKEESRASTAAAAKIAAGPSSVATVELLEHMRPMNKENHALLQMAAEINEADKLEKFSSSRPTDRGDHTLMQMATEIQEEANSENTGTSSSRSAERAGISQDTRPGQLASGNGSVPQTLLHRTQRISHPSLPGAYMGTPGEALERTSTLQYSLLGAPAANTDYNDELQIDQSQADALPHVLPNGINNNNDQQLAVANLVAEDPEDFERQMRPSASPVDLQMVEARQQKKRRQTQLFILFLVMLCIAAATIVGAVAGTRKEKDQGATSSSQTATPTAFGSMQPSEVPSSAPSGVLDFMLEHLPDHTLESLQTFGTPQRQAWDWLLNHQNITPLPEWRKTQLFALATYYYSFEGENWFQPIKERWMDDSLDECLWYSSGFSYFNNGVYTAYSSSSATLPCNHLGEYTSLWVEALRLSGLAPVVPPEITLLTSLSQIGLGWNLISSSIDIMLPSEIYKMTALASLNFAGNQFNGGIPTELGLLTTLKLLRLDKTEHLSDPIPSELGFLTALTALLLDDNQLTGQVPSELGQLTDLNRMTLDFNQLTGQLPTELGLLTSLTSLFLAHNELKGQIATELARASSLNELLLQANHLTGQVSTEFGMMANLTVFAAGKNLLTGPIPSELGLLSLTGFWLGENEMSGQVPTEIWSISGWEILYLQSNSFAGSLSSEIGLWSSLVELDLSENHFTGKIPNEVGSVSSLQKLYLYNNSFTGMLPLELNESMGLRLDGNQFSGTVPEHLCSALWCDCAANVTLVSTCADLNEPSIFPGRFPPIGTDGTNEMIVLNIESDAFPTDTKWVWQKETNVSGVWETLQESAGAIQTPFFLYSFRLSIAEDATYRLVVSDGYGDGFFPSGWITLTASNQTELYAFTAVETHFTEVSVVLLVGAGGSVEDINPKVYCDPAYDLC